MQHIFIHSSADGQFRCFNVVAIVNSTAMNIGVHVPFQINVFALWGYTLYLGVEWLGHVVALFLIF